MPGSPRLIVSSPSALSFGKDDSEQGNGDSPVAIGGVVKSLRESPRRVGRYEVTLDDGRQYLVGVDVLASLGATKTGVSLDASAVGALARASRVTEVVDRAVATIARGRRTRRELEGRMRRRESDTTIIADALDRLEASGVLCDTDVALAEAAARLRRGEAPTRVRQTLRQKGIASQDANDAVSTAIEENGFDEVASCRALAQKRSRSVATLAPAVARRRLIGFLQRRGFSGSVIRIVLDEIKRERATPET